MSDLLKINVTINLEVNVVNMTTNRLKNKILHTKIRLRHASNPLKNGCATGKKFQTHLVSECIN